MSEHPEPQTDLPDNESVQLMTGLTIDNPHPVYADMHRRLDRVEEIDRMLRRRALWSLLTMLLLCVVWVCIVFLSSMD